jgi:hypothetical protein
MEPIPVSFSSDDYFALVAARPEWGRYFALGDHVIVVLEGKAYEVREGEAPPVEAPDGNGDPAGVDAPPLLEPTPEEAAAMGAGTPVSEPEPEQQDSLLEAVAEAIASLMQAIADALHD